MVDWLNGQDCLYHVNLQGKENGQAINTLERIDVISRALNPYSQNQAFMALAEQPEMRFIISNTTEAGIAFDDSCKFTDAPAASYPGKLVQLLFHRYKFFEGDPTKGMILMPCELIFLNGHHLKECIYQYIELWKGDMGADYEGFKEWFTNHCYVCATLVDRIGKIVDNSKDFIDTQDHWAEDEIDFVSARGLVNGMSATIYAPNNSTTRAQLWTILARQNDANLNSGNTWYESAQNWAKAKGVSDGANPNAAINRAQMVTMLWRAEGQPAAGGTASFTDVSADSYYAQAVAWAVENGITTGVGGGRFDPTATCTRAQIAAFLARSMK